jgi:hypothetical protein
VACASCFVASPVRDDVVVFDILAQTTRDRIWNPVPAVFHSGSQAFAFIRSRIAGGTVVRADETDQGTICMSDLKSSGSTTRKLPRWMGPALIKRRNTSAAYAALKSASTLTLRAHTSSDMRRRVNGIKPTGV